MVALVALGSDGTWSVQWASDSPGMEPQAPAASADSAKAFVEGQMEMITTLRWQRLGRDWVAYRRNR